MFYDRFVELCKAKGMSPAAVAREIGLSNSSTTTWKRGSLPKADTLQKLAEYFEVSVDYLLDLSPEDKKFLYESISAEILMALLRNLYGAIELKSVIGQYGSGNYYLVGVKDGKFILHENDVDTLSRFMSDSVKTMVERLKDVRPEQQVIDELRKHLDSESVRQAMNASMEEHIKKFPETAAYFKPYPPPQSPLDSTEGKDPTPPPDGSEGPPKGE